MAPTIADATDIDVGTLPTCENPARRDACWLSLQLFLQTYFPRTVAAPFTPDQTALLTDISFALRYGRNATGLLSRGQGKSTIAIATAVWSVLYRHSPFVLLVGPTQQNAEHLLDAARTWLTWSDELTADFPEVVLPLRHLERNPGAAGRQKCGGRPTRTRWNRRQIILPATEHGWSNGATIRAESVLASPAGITHQLPDGQRIRPSVVILDCFPPGKPVEVANRRAGAVAFSQVSTDSVVCLDQAGQEIPPAGTAV